jgi:aryl-alcohol dehydrogenase-like predicted oxidoreductase
MDTRTLGDSDRERHRRLPGEVAIAWVLGNPAVTGAIVGVRSARQAAQVMRAADLRLTDDEIAEVEGTPSMSSR